jgi:hypothetical protein
VQASSPKDSEQLIWDQHNLRGALKRVLSQVVAEAPDGTVCGFRQAAGHRCSAPNAVNLVCSTFLWQWY